MSARVDGRKVTFGSHVSVKGLIGPGSTRRLVVKTFPSKWKSLRLLPSPSKPQPDLIDRVKV